MTLEMIEHAPQRRMEAGAAAADNCLPRPDWNDPALFGRFREMWDEGRSLTAIATDLSSEFGVAVTRNSIAGKANRSGFPARVPPMEMEKSRARLRDLVESCGEQRETAAGRMLGLAADLMSQVEAHGEQDRVGRVLELAGSRHASRRSARAAAARKEEDGPAETAEARRVGPSCCWPVGDPRSRDFHFCGAEAVRGKSYCADHAARAYVKPRKVVA
jgi:GcrA cell cycle regulator